MRYGLRVGDDGVASAEQVMAMTREAGFGAEVKRRIIIGTYALSSGYYDASRAGAEGQKLISRDFDQAFSQVDVLVSPATPVTAFKIGEKVDDPLASVHERPVHDSVQFGRQRECIFPVGLAPEDGLPVGLQVIAPPLADDRLYRVGAALEAALSRTGVDHCWIASPSWAQSDDRAVVRGGAAAYDPVLGLECTRRTQHHLKMFCGCSTAFGAEPNTQVCPVCLGLPGSPVVNAKAVESAIRIGLALNCTIAEWCRFARKNYFYPDMPKNYQISQYDEPIAYDGWTEVVLDGDLPDRHRAGPHGGGHGQVATCGRRDRTDPRRRLFAAGLQPVRRTADRDRHEADRGTGA